MKKKVVCPTIYSCDELQGFRWAIDSDKWQARVDSIKAVFEGDFISIDQISKICQVCNITTLL